jgi:hypothetical protein
VDVPGNVPGYGLPDGANFSANLITNADTGVLLSWRMDWEAGALVLPAPVSGMAVTNGTSVTLVNQPQLPLPTDCLPFVTPVLQAQDGSFVGTAYTCSGPNVMVAFDVGGNTRWIVPNEQPAIAVADGNIIGQSGTTYDANGNAFGSVGPLPTYSWKGAYTDGVLASVIPLFDLALVAQTKAAVPNGNLTGNGVFLNHHTFGIKYCGDDGPCTYTEVENAAPIRYIYLPWAQWDQCDRASTCPAYQNAQNGGDSDFTHRSTPGGTAWTDIIKLYARTQYFAAFAHLPAIVARQTNGTIQQQKIFNGAMNLMMNGTFEHTLYVNGGWRDDGFGITQTGCQLGTCVRSFLWFPNFIGTAQQNLAAIEAGGDITFKPPAISPTLSPGVLSLSVEQQFENLMRTIGYGIGSSAAHETGHQLFLPYMDCNDKCPGNGIVFQSRNGGSWGFGALFLGNR